METIACHKGLMNGVVHTLYSRILPPPSHWGGSKERVCPSTLMSWGGVGTLVKYSST